MDDCIALMHNAQNFFSEADNHIQELYSLQSKNKIYRAIRHLFLKYRLPFYKRYFGKWIHKIRTLKTVVIFDNGNMDIIPKRIHEMNPDIRIILWFWNPIENASQVEKIDRSICEVWSFNEKDCDKYALKYNTQFYIEDVLKEKPDTMPLWDVYFLGLDKKGRSKILQEIDTIFKEKSISFNYILVPTFFELNSNLKYGEKISYQDNIKNVRSSKAVLDIINPAENHGITLRVLEAMHYGKKLITNDSDVKRLSFYNTKNIFIYGEDDIGLLEPFVNTPFDHSKDGEVEYYSFTKWLSRFSPD